MEQSRDNNGNSSGNGSHLSNPFVQAEGVAESLFVVLWRHMAIIIISAVLALIGAFIYLSKAVPIFESTSHVYVEQTGPRIIKELEEGVMTGSKNYLYTQAELLKATERRGVLVDEATRKQLIDAEQDRRTQGR